jgi:hypothetical protein
MELVHFRSSDLAYAQHIQVPVKLAELTNGM